MILGEEGSVIVCTFVRGTGDKSAKSGIRGEKSIGTKYKVLLSHDCVEFISYLPYTDAFW